MIDVGPLASVPEIRAHQRLATLIEGGVDVDADHRGRCLAVDRVGRRFGMLHQVFETAQHQLLGMKRVLGTVDRQQLVVQLQP